MKTESNQKGAGGDEWGDRKCLELLRKSCNKALPTKIPLYPLIPRISLLRVDMSQKSDTSFIHPTRIITSLECSVLQILRCLRESNLSGWVSLLQLSEMQAAKQPLTSGHINKDVVPKFREVIFSIYFILTRFLESGD